MERTLKMPSLEIATIIDSVLKLLGGALGVKLFEHYWLKRKAQKEEKQKENFVANLKDISLMNHFMEDVIENTAADSFLILMGHDSGNIPNPKHPYFAKAMWQKVKHEESDNDETNLLRKFDSIRVDFAYINMIIEIMTKGCIKIDVKTMPNCFLKMMYHSEKIQYSEVYFLAQEKSNKIYYCSIATTKPGEKFTNFQERAKIELAINHIRQIFAKV